MGGSEYHRDQLKDLENVAAKNHKRKDSMEFVCWTMVEDQNLISRHDAGWEFQGNHPNFWVLPAIPLGTSCKKEQNTLW